MGNRLGGGHTELISSGGRGERRSQVLREEGVPGMGELRGGATAPPSRLPGGGSGPRWGQTMEASSGGVRRGVHGARPHPLRRMLGGLGRDAGRSEKHTADTMPRAGLRRPPPRAPGAAMPASPGTRLEGLQGAASRADGLPLPAAATTMEPRSGVRLPRGLAQPAPRTRPPSASRGRGPTPAGRGPRPGCPPRGRPRRRRAARRCPALPRGRPGAGAGSRPILSDGLFFFS